jgi:hypothetical protein
MNLIGFRNRLVVMVTWGRAWVTFQRGVRLITGENPERVAAPGVEGARHP